MLTSELFPTVTTWFIESRHFYLVNLGAAMCSVALGLIAYKIYYTQDGIFRRCLLWYFGTAAGWMLSVALLYHPCSNPWMTWVTAIPVFFAQLRLSMYFFVIFGLGRRKSHRLPELYREEKQYATRRHKHDYQ